MSESISSWVLASVSSLDFPSSLSYTKSTIKDLFLSPPPLGGVPVRRYGTCIRFLPRKIFDYKKNIVNTAKQ
jgi:hypothetical protein